jgi:hypothetical protein
MYRIKKVREKIQKLQDQIKELTDNLHKLQLREEQLIQQSRESSNKYYQQNKERLIKTRDYDRMREYNREYYLRTKAIKTKKNKEHYFNNTEKAKHYGREYYYNVKKNKSKIEKLSKESQQKLLAKIEPYQYIPVRVVIQTEGNIVEF